VTLHLDLPITVQVAEPDAPDAPREAAAAVEAAVTRAGAVAVRELLAPRGRRRTVRVHEPTVVLPASLRGPRGDALADAVRAAVWRGVTQAGLTTWTDADPGSDVTDRWVAEAVDPTRVRGGTYRIPYYDEDVTEISFDDDELVAEIVGDEPVPLTRALAAAWRHHVNRRGGAPWEPGRPDYPGYYCRVQGASGSPWTLVIITNVRGEIAADGSIASVEQLDWESQQPYNAKPEPGPGSTVRIVPQPLELGYDYELRLAPGDPREIATQVISRSATRSPELQWLVDVPALQTVLVDQILGENGAAFEVLGGPEPLTLFGPPDTRQPIRFATSVAVGLPTTEEGGGGTGGELEGPGAREGGGTGDPGSGDGGEGGGGGPLGDPNATGTGTSRTWPVWGTGEKFVCAPFKGEPRLGELAVGADALRPRLERLAALLEVEMCDYPGNFLLHLADAISTRARGVGMRSTQIASTSAVTLRADGRGSMGFLDLDPMRAPEVAYYQRLAGAVSEVHSLGQLLFQVWELTDNRPLVRRDSEPDSPPDWIHVAYRFHLELYDRLTDCCTFVFGETCRSLFLHQLRASRASIEERQGPRFEDGLTRFRQSMDILGASVVRMSTLLLAITHSRAVYTEGSVVDVLSTPEVITDGEGGSYEMPAPSTWIRPTLMDTIRGARVERRGGERVIVDGGNTWTERDLQAAVGIRRGALNQVDPIFNQLDDLDSVFHRTGTEAGARQFLTDLLARMHSRNSEMITESSESDDGMWFALEATQWYEAEGGRDANGLRYRLIGLHRMADDVLGPQARHVKAYVDGVNQALDQKAGWDAWFAVAGSIGIVALAIACAPLGATAAAVIVAGASIALAVHDWNEADRMRAQHLSLEDPEALRAFSDVQAAELTAMLSAAFAIFDVIAIGKVAAEMAQGVVRAMRVAAETGEAATRAAARAARERIARETAEALVEAGVRQALQAAVMAAAMQVLLPHVIGPVLVDHLRGEALRHGGRAEVEAALSALPPSWGTGAAAVPAALAPPDPNAPDGGLPPGGPPDGGAPDGGVPDPLDGGAP
jgi:hypothetical protein